MKCKRRSQLINGKGVNILTGDDTPEVAFEGMGRRSSYGKSLLEKVSIRRPSINYDEFPDILDSDGNSIDPGTDDISIYTFEAKVSETEDNPVMYYVHFRNEMDFLGVDDEILRHNYVESIESQEPDIIDLQDTSKGVLKIRSIDTLKGKQRLHCQFYDMDY